MCVRKKRKIKSSLLFKNIVFNFFKGSLSKKTYLLKSCKIRKPEAFCKDFSFLCFLNKEALTYGKYMIAQKKQIKKDLLKRGGLLFSQRFYT